MQYGHDCRIKEIIAYIYNIPIFSRLPGDFTDCHVGVPDRPSNRGVFPGGPKSLEILVRVVCYASGVLSQVSEHPETHAKGGYPAGAGRPQNWL